MAENIQISIESSKGVLLKTAGKYCETDIEVTVASSGGDATTADMVAEGGHAVINLPNVTKIKQYAFREDLILTDVIMPKVTSIGNYAFYSCTSLALTSLPSGLTGIGGDAFSSCYSLAISEIPEGVTSIGAYAFKQCTKLTAITFKGTPTSIKSTAFNTCTKLTTINVPWAEGAVSGAPWGATNATIHYNYTGG